MSTPKAEELLLHVADHHDDVVDARFLELADLALDEHFAAHLEHAFGALVGKGGEARRQAGGHDDGVLHAVGGKGREPGGRHLRLVHEPLVGELAVLPVHDAERKPGRVCYVALRAHVVADERGKHVECVSGQTHECPPGRKDVSPIVRVCSYL